MNAPRAERRLAAILAADVAGYSRLVEHDEVGTVARLKALRKETIAPILDRHGGRIASLAGDGAIVEFGSVVEAVQAAVEVQAVVADHEAEQPEEARIRFRMGVNLGDVIHEDGDLYGGGVNVAARLEQLCAPGEVLLSGTAFDQVEGRLPFGFEFRGEQRVKNIERPVRVYRARPDAATVRRHRKRLTPRHVGMAAATATAVLAVLGGAWWFWPTRPTAPPIQSIAVLPFDNYGGDEATGRLADGITEDIITDLARFRDLDVIARNSSDVYKGKPVDVREVGRDLNVRYVLEGSVQRQAERVRVTAQLVDANSADHVWSERWDRPTGDVFAVQTEVSERVASTLGGYNLLHNESRIAAKRKRPADLQAYDLVVLADEPFLRGTEADLEQALALTNTAIARDPGMARAYIKKAWVLNSLKRFRKNYKETWAAMEVLARTAIEADPYEAEAYAVLAFATNGLNRGAESLAATNRAVELNPSSADILNMLAEGMVDRGSPEQGAAWCDRSFRLNPSPPDWYGAFCHAAYFHTNRYQEAITALDRWGAYSKLTLNMITYRAADLAELGRDREAAETVAQMRQLYPEVSLESLMNGLWSYDREREEQKIIASAKKGGVRVCATAEELRPFPSPRRLPECSSKPTG